MFNLPTPAEDAAFAERLVRQIEALQALTELGMGMARAISADAQAPAGAPRRLTGDLVLMFTRISKAIRMTLVLEARLAEGLRTGRMSHAGRAAETSQPAATAVAEADEDAPDRADDVEPGESLRAERNERLTDPDEFASLDRRPIGEWVAIICEHLGVPFDAPLWVGDDPELEVATPRPIGAHDPGPSSPHPAARPPASFRGRGPSP